MNTDKKSSRLNPMLWEHQYYVLVNMRKVIERVFVNEVHLTPGDKVVDIGCGDCPYEPIFKNYECEYIACDLNGDVDVKVEVGKQIPLPSDFASGIVSFQVLEHVWDLDWYFSNCYRILKDGGWLLLSTHGNWPYHPHPEDYRRWTRPGLIKQLEEKGFKVKVVYPVVGPLAWTTQFCLLGLFVLCKKIPFFGNLVLVPITVLMNIFMMLEDLITPKSFRDLNACVYVTLSYK